MSSKPLKTSDSAILADALTPLLLRHAKSSRLSDRPRFFAEGGCRNPDPAQRRERQVETVQTSRKADLRLLRIYQFAHNRQRAFPLSALVVHNLPAFAANHLPPGKVPSRHQ